MAETTKEFICEYCQGTFERGWTEEEAAAEFGDNFPGNTADDLAEICDECYKEFMSWYNSPSGASPGD